MVAAELQTSTLQEEERLSFRRLHGLHDLVERLYSFAPSGIEVNVLACFDCGAFLSYTPGELC
jgi:hypothetical protein